MSLIRVGPMFVKSLTAQQSISLVPGPPPSCLPKTHVGRSCMSTALYGHRTVWAPHCMGTALHGHRTVCAPHCMGTALKEHRTVCAPHCMCTALHVHRTVRAPQ